MEFALVALAFVLVGFLIGRWYIVLLAVPFWLVLFVGSARGRWGEEVRQGEFAEYFVAVTVLVSCLGILVGVLLRKLSARGRRST